ncbi:lipocalin family protein [Catenovulum maritimum]|uniref:lipocalin family protein n=1 Tax=Catenovulum maritimum TaxID=1513271 RepID=UPI0006609528|nr:lipocalin family protein [Catenovulum maritimum]
MKKVSLPADDAFLTDELAQWWYWTGHLKTKCGKNFGFELCFFAVDADASHLFELIAHKIHGNQVPHDLLTVQMMNAAITDIDNNKFYSRVDYLPGPPKVIENGFSLENIFKNCRATGGDGNDKLTSKVNQFELSLDVKSQKPAVVHYQGDKYDYTFGGYTYYYSRESMVADGSLTIAGTEYEVEGEVWFDRQYGDLLQACFLVGWQWFAIQLDDNTQIMVFAYHSEADQMASITDSAGNTTQYSPSEFAVEILQWWKSPHTGKNYPAKWKIQIADYELTITPQVQDQELHEAWLFPKYWEGACTVEGNQTGSAYVELVGYKRKHWL